MRVGLDLRILNPRRAVRGGACFSTYLPTWVGKGSGEWEEGRGGGERGCLGTRWKCDCIGMLVGSGTGLVVCRGGGGVVGLGRGARKGGRERGGVLSALIAETRCGLGLPRV